MVGHMDCGTCGGRHSPDMLCVDLRSADVVPSDIAPDWCFHDPDDWSRKFLTITAEGRIIIEDGITMDEAARGFVQALRNLGCCVEVHDEEET